MIPIKWNYEALEKVKMDLKRYLDSGDDIEEESSLVQISRSDLKRYQLMEALYVGDVDIILASLPEDRIKEIKEYCPREHRERYVYIYISERLRIGFKRHGSGFNPKCEVFLGNELSVINQAESLPINVPVERPAGHWFNVFPYEEDDVRERFGIQVGDESAVSNEVILSEIFKEATKDEEAFFQRCNHYAHKQHCALREDRINFTPVKFDEFLSEGEGEDGLRGRKHYEGWIKVTDVPSLGWARFIRRISFEPGRIIPRADGQRGFTQYKKWIVKKKDKWDVRLASPLILKGNDKISRFIHYYASLVDEDVNGDMVRGIIYDRNIRGWWDFEQAVVIVMAQMHKVYEYVDENGESSDEEIAEWLNTATKW